MSIKTQVAQGLKWQAITIAGRQLLSVAVFTMLARLLEPSAFGQLALIGVFTFFAGMLSDLGTGTALMQRPELDKEHLDSAFWFNLGTGILLFVGALIFAGPLATILGEPSIAALLCWCSLTIPIRAFVGVHNTLFVKAMDFRRPAIRTLVANALGGVVGIGMALAGCGVWALVGQELAAALSGSIFLWAASSYRPSLYFSAHHLGSLLRVGLSVSANSFIWFFTSRMDQFIIGRFAGVDTLGLYVVGGKAPDLVRMATQQPLSEVLLPALAKLQNDLPRMCQAICRGAQLNAAVVFPIFVGLAAVAPDLVPLLFGDKWVKAAIICSLLSIHTLIGATQIFYYPALVASGLPNKLVVLSLLQAVGVLIACVVGIQFGIVYLVTGLIINSLINLVPVVLLVQRRIGVNPFHYFRTFTVPAVASVVMLGTVLFTATELPADSSRWFRLGFEVIVGAVVYVILVHILSPDIMRAIIQAVRTAILRRNCLPPSETMPMAK